MSKTVRIGGAQGFYGDSPYGAMQMLVADSVDYLMHDALAELTLSILQKDRERDPNMGYARDIEFNAKLLYPFALSKGVKIVTNAGGLNPEAAAKKVLEIMKGMGLSPKIAIVTGDDVLDRLPTFMDAGLELQNLDTQKSFSECKYKPTNANVYIGAGGIKEALEGGAQIILAGRVADPSLCLGILAYEHGWDLESEKYLNEIANGIMVGHILECGGQASGGNSYAEWPQAYSLSELGYPIAQVAADGSAVITKAEGSGGKVSRLTVREQLVYEIHDPTAYLTPDVTVDFTKIKVEDIGPDKVSVSGAIGKPRPEQLKLAICVQECYCTEQIFMFSWPYAYEKARRFAEACRETWDRTPVQLDEIRIEYVGLNAIHGESAPRPSDEWIAQMPEIGVRLVLRHKDKYAGKMALQSIVCLGLNGPPGAVANPAWGKDGRAMLSLWPTLIPRDLIDVEVCFFE